MLRPPVVSRLPVSSLVASATITKAHLDHHPGASG